MSPPSLGLRSLAVLLAALIPWFARAQAPSPASDPPALVGRIARVQGSVSSHQAGAAQWEPADVNQPVTSGTGVWTEQRAGADVETPGARIALDQATELDVAQLDEQALVVTLPQGAIVLALDGAAGGEGAHTDVQVQTPRGVVQVGAATAGRYAVMAGDADHPTQVTVLEGAATVTGQALQVQVGPGQTATINGDTALTATLGPATEDAFVQAALAREQPPAVLAGPPQVRRVTGADALAGHGRWHDAGHYGEVWQPDVPATYVPYRQGHWAWVAPWGWTWVDDAPWGFTTSHYGRWVEWEDSWVWAPTVPEAPVDAVPVYAPAVVNFVEVGAVFAAGAALGAAIEQPTAWVPLAPDEPYVPPYRASNTYVRNINVVNVTHVNTITAVNRPVAPAALLNRKAATVVPAAVMIQSRPVQAVARPVPAAALEHAQVVREPPVRPGPATAGLTAAAARQIGVPPPTRPAAPGPAIRSASFAVRQPPVTPAHAPAQALLPPLRPAGGAPPPAPGAPVQPPAAPAAAGHPTPEPHQATEHVPPAPGGAVQPPPPVPAAGTGHVSSAVVAHPVAPAVEAPHAGSPPPAHPPLVPTPANPATPQSRPEPHPAAALPAPQPPHPAANPASRPAVPKAVPHPAPPLVAAPPRPMPPVPVARAPATLPHPASVPASHPAEPIGHAPTSPPPVAHPAPPAPRPPEPAMHAPPPAASHPPPPAAAVHPTSPPPRPPPPPRPVAPQPPPPRPQPQQPHPQRPQDKQHAPPHPS